MLRDVKSGLGHVTMLERGVDEVSFKIGPVTRSIQGCDSGHPKPKNVQHTVLVYSHQESHCPRFRSILPLSYRVGLSPKETDATFSVCSLGSSLNLYLHLYPRLLVSASALTQGFYHQTRC